MQRRQFLRGSAALLSAAPLGAAVAADIPAVSGSSAATLLSDSRELTPMVASPDRIIEMNVCTRPFRAQGPRIEVERIGRKQVCTIMGTGAAAGPFHGAADCWPPRWRREQAGSRLPLWVVGPSV